MKNRTPASVPRPASPATVLLVLLAVFAGGLWAAAPPAVDLDALNAAVNAQVRGALHVAPQLGVEVADVASGAPVYTYDADELRIPASNTKLFTTSAALATLGPGYVFETPLLARGRVEGGVLHGDLAVVGAGDPTISERFTGDGYSAFRPWAAALRERGIGRVEGDLLLVDGFFEGREIHPDWPTDQLAHWYEAPIAALSFNDNCVWVQVSPSKSGHARVDVRPHLGLFPVQNLTQVSGSRRSHQVIVTRRPEASEIEVRGSVYRGASPLDTWITVPDPVAYFGAALTQALGQEGVALRGETRALERLPAGAWERIAAHRTSLLTAIEVANKRSQNFYAESLLKTLGAEHCGDGSWRGGLEAVAEFLERAGIEPGSYHMVDGSGMSRANRFSADQVVRLLRHMYAHRWGEELVRSLPASGEMGASLEKRLTEAPYRGNVFAKTGTLDGVSALSGFARARSGRLYVFSILANRTHSAWQARRAQDAIVRAIIDHG